MFDANMPTYIRPKYLMLTHTHSDHSFNLPKQCIQIFPKSKINPIFVPYESKM